MQEGIYYRTKPTIGKSFCIVSLRAENPSKISEIGYTIGTIWNRLKKLKEGITADLDIDIKHRKVGNLTTLIAYGSRLFDLSGSKKERPTSFTEMWNFKDPDPTGGGDLLEGTGLCYSKKVLDNHLLRDHVLFQFIAENEFYTNRAAVEVWKEIYRQGKGNPSQLRISGLYQGFQREDKRNWLGFHDGVSNLKMHERPYVILINSRHLSSQDKWTTYGTYLAFIRISIDLERWEGATVKQQERIIGRHKLTGCPLIKLDIDGNPVKDSRCPVPGTTEIIDRGNEYFRDHPPYGITNESKILQHSHIGSTRPIDQIPFWDKKSLRIYRQGFEFLVPSKDPPNFDAGLNFVSFQNTPERLFRSLTYQQMIYQKGTLLPSIPKLDQFTSVLVAGIFFVPPIAQNEAFPGSQIFFNTSEMRQLLNYRKV